MMGCLIPDTHPSLGPFSSQTASFWQERALQDRVRVSHTRAFSVGALVVLHSQSFFCLRGSWGGMEIASLELSTGSALETKEEKNCGFEVVSVSLKYWFYFTDKVPFFGSLDGNC